MTAALAAGCTSGGDTPTAEPSQTPAAAPAPTSTTSSAPARAAIKVGDKLTTYFQTPEAVVTLLSVETDPTCTYTDGYTKPDPRPHRVALQMRVESLETTGFVNAPSFNISELLPNGTVATKDAHNYQEFTNCLGERPELDTIDAGTTQEGWMLFAVDNPTGTLLWVNGQTVGQQSTIAYPQTGSAATTAQPSPAAPAAEETTTEATTAPPAATTSSSSPIGDDVPRQGPEPCSGYSGCSGVDTGPGCGGRAVAAGSFNPNCTEYQGYLDPGQAAGRAPSSSDLQTQYGCEQGYITGPVCDPYR